MQTVTLEGGWPRYYMVKVTVHLSYFRTCWIAFLGPFQSAVSMKIFESKSGLSIFLSNCHYQIINTRYSWGLKIDLLVGDLIWWPIRNRIKLTNRLIPILLLEKLHNHPVGADSEPQLWSPVVRPGPPMPSSDQFRSVRPRTEPYGPSPSPKFV